MNYEVFPGKKNIDAGGIRYSERYNVPKGDPKADGSRTKKPKGGPSARQEG